MGEVTFSVKIEFDECKSSKDNIKKELYDFIKLMVIYDSSLWDFDIRGVI